MSSLLTTIFGEIFGKLGLRLDIGPAKAAARAGTKRALFREAKYRQDRNGLYALTPKHLLPSRQVQRKDARAAAKIAAGRAKRLARASIKANRRAKAAA